MTNRRGLDNSPDFSRDYFVNLINCEQAFFVVVVGGGGGFFLSSTSKKKRPLSRSLFGNKPTPSELSSLSTVQRTGNWEVRNDLKSRLLFGKKTIPRIYSTFSAL